MAITKIHAIKNTVNKAIDYITDPDKTDGQLLVSGYNCEAMTAHLDFKITSTLAKEIKGDYSKTGGADNLAYHLIQSFSPEDNVTPEMAHDIGKKLANEFLENKYEYIISTHIDKGHIHNHIILNAVSFYDFKKIRTQPYKTAANIRAISDRLCSEYDLSVIKERGKLGYSYTEYKERKNDTSWKSEIRKKINYILESATSYDEFKSNAKALGVEVNDSGKHIKYRADGQERYTRGNKLADTERFLREGIIEQVNINKSNIEFLHNAIKETIKSVNDYESFVSTLKSKYSITVKKERSGNTSYLLDDLNGSVVKERVLDSNFNTDNIKLAIGKDDFEFDKYTDIDIAEEYNKSVKTKVEENDTRVILKDDNILKVTVDGILVEIPDALGYKGKVFIDSRHINYLEHSNQYEIYIGDKYDYYYVNDIVNPDILESEQLSSKYVKGESLIRSLEAINGIKPVEIQLDSADIKSLSVKGITISLPDKGIESLFIENQYVNYDKLNNTCTVKVYENWNYNYRNDDASKNTLNNIKGKAIIDLLENRDIGDNSILVRKITALERRIDTSDTKMLAETLVLLRREGIEKVSEFDIKIQELKVQCGEIKDSIKALEGKNEQYKEAAKYLVSYNKYLPVKLEYEKQSVIAKKGFYKKNESELLAFEHALKQLDKLGINSTVDPNKVMELIKQQTQQTTELNTKFKDTELHIDELRKAKVIVEDIVTPKSERNIKQVHENEKSKASEEL